MDFLLCVCLYFTGKQNISFGGGAIFPQCCRLSSVPPSPSNPLPLQIICDALTHAHKLHWCNHFFCLVNSVISQYRLIVKVERHFISLLILYYTLLALLVLMLLDKATAKQVINRFQGQRHVTLMGKEMNINLNSIFVTTSPFFDVSLTLFPVSNINP